MSTQLISLVPDSSAYNCQKRDPLLKYDPNAEAPELRYNLPISTSLKAHTRIPLVNDPLKFKPDYRRAPIGNRFDIVQNLSAAEIESQLLDSLGQQSGSPLIINAGQLKPGIKPAVVKPKGPLGVANGNIKQRIINGGAVSALQPEEELHIAGEKFSDMVSQVMKGKVPMVYTKPFGTLGIRYLAPPKETKPVLYMVEHYKISTYLGDYGVGKVVKTFSLFPGERTSIALRSFKRNEETKKRSENVIDSSSEESMNELQNTVENENSANSSTSSSNSSTTSFGASLEVGGVIASVVGIGASGGFDQSNSNSIQSTRDTAVRSLTNAISNQVAQSNSSREVEVNTESVTTTITEEENTTTREIANINLSRTMNLIFRQLLQETFTITSLDDVTFVFENGYPEHTKTCKLSGLNTLLTEVLEDTEVEEVRQAIHAHLCNVYDYQDVAKPFIEKVDQSFTSCFDGSTSFTNNYVRKKRGLAEPYENVLVDGIILNVTSRTLRTDSVIVDALLGNGDALDCYNERLQNEDFRSSYLNNQKTAVGLELFNLGGMGLEGVANATKDDRTILTDVYKKLYGSCCPGPIVPSTIDVKADIGFGKDGEKETPTTTPVSPPQPKVYVGSAQLVFEEFPADGGDIDMEGELTLLSPTINGADPHLVGNGTVTITGNIPSTGGFVTLTGTLNYTYPNGISGVGTYEIKGTVPAGGGFTEFSGSADITVTLPDSTTKIEKPNLTLATDVPVTAGGVFALAGPTVEVVG